MTNTTPIVQGIVSGSKAFVSEYTWPSHTCIKEDEPDLFFNVGAYANNIWEKLKEEGGDECQTDIEVKV